LSGVFESAIRKRSCPTTDTMLGYLSLFGAM
jgi:hypothetical protein